MHWERIKILCGNIQGVGLHSEKRIEKMSKEHNKSMSDNTGKQIIQVLD